MKNCKINCLLIFSCLIYTFSQMLFKLSMCRGNKLCLANLANLDKEKRLMHTTLKKEKKAIDAWTKQTPVKTIKLYTKDKAKLYGRYYIQQQSNKWIIIVHGYGENGELMLYAAKRFYDAGYNVLLPDLRAHGKSTGQYICWGWNDRKDLCLWCKCILSIDKKAKIAMYGVSMGGAASLMAAGENPNRLKAVIADCAYTSLTDIMRYRIRRMLHLSPCMVMWWLTSTCKKRMDLRIEDVSVLNQIKKCKIPIMLCHGDRDRFVPTDSALELYAVAPKPKKLMLVHGAGHGVSAFVGGEKYWQKVIEFAEKYIN